MKGDSLQQGYLVCEQNGKKRRVNENWSQLKEGVCIEKMPLRES